MQRQGAFAFLHQSAHAGKMVNIAGKLRNGCALCEARQAMRPPAA
jgi:hypothetical protein